MPYVVHRPAPVTATIATMHTTAPNFWNGVGDDNDGAGMYHTGNNSAPSLRPSSNGTASGSIGVSGSAASASCVNSQSESSTGESYADSFAQVTSPRSFPQSRYTAPSGACEVILVRHGESAPYVEGDAFPLTGGHGDPPLAPEGHESAELMAQRLVATEERIGAIYVTTLQRTHQTAAPLAARLGIEPVVVPELREVFLGDWEGGEFRRRAADLDPIIAQVHDEQRWDAVPGAETTEQFSARVRAGIERIASRHQGETVVAVVHGGVIGQIVGLATGANGFAFAGADNASISHLVVTADRWIVRCFNDTSHLWPTFSNAPVA